jgi:hypothetical protein
MFAIHLVQKNVYLFILFSLFFSLLHAFVCVCACVSALVRKIHLLALHLLPGLAFHNIYCDWFANSLQISLLYFCNTAGLVVM